MIIIWAMSKNTEFIISCTKLKSICKKPTKIQRKHLIPQNKDSLENAHIYMLAWGSKSFLTQPSNAKVLHKTYTKTHNRVKCYINRNIQFSFCLFIFFLKGFKRTYYLQSKNIYMYMEVKREVVPKNQLVFIFKE